MLRATLALQWRQRCVSFTVKLPVIIGSCMYLAFIFSLIWKDNRFVWQQRFAVVLLSYPVCICICLPSERRRQSSWTVWMQLRLRNSGKSLKNMPFRLKLTVWWSWSSTLSTRTRRWAGIIFTQTCVYIFLFKTFLTEFITLFCAADLP